MFITQNHRKALLEGDLIQWDKKEKCIKFYRGTDKLFFSDTNTLPTDHKYLISNIEEDDFFTLAKIIADSHGWRIEWEEGYNLPTYRFVAGR